MKLLAGVITAALLTAGCGYHVSGRANTLPKTVRTIAVPAFNNATSRYKLTQRLAGAITREFISRTRYRVVAEPKKADAVLRGAVVNFYSYPTVFDQATGRAAGIETIVVLDIRLIDRKTGATLYRNSGMSIHNRYETSSDQMAYFEESEVALDRLSRDVARTVVSAVLENF